MRDVNCPRFFQGTRGRVRTNSRSLASHTWWVRPSLGGSSASLKRQALSHVSCPPSSHTPLPLQVGIQVVSEDLCSEKQWSVCKALATFVAHRELSKVESCPRCSAPLTLP